MLKRRNRTALEAVASTKVPTVRVVPTSEDYRRVLKHPCGMRFRETGSVAWPLDSFTRRRIAEGSIKIEEEHKGEPGNEREPRHRKSSSSSSSE